MSTNERIGADMNKKIYIWTIIISLLLLIPACIWDHNILTIISGIGCSGIAAAIMAVFLESAALKKEKERKIKARAIYFREVKDQLKMMIERILWFDQRLMMTLIGTKTQRSTHPFNT